MDKKDYSLWHSRKTWLNNDKPRVFFHEREVWWSSIGMNIGFEQDGKGNKFLRPVVIFKKFNNQIFWAVPLTTKSKSGKFYLPVDVADGVPRSAILSQLRLMDSKRLLTKLGFISVQNYQEMKKAFMKLCQS